MPRSKRTKNVQPLNRSKRPKRSTVHLPPKGRTGITRVGIVIIIPGIPSVILIVNCVEMRAMHWILTLNFLNTMILFWWLTSLGKRIVPDYNKEPRWEGATIRGPITKVKQLWAQSILGWVTVQDTVLVAKDVIITCHVPLWLMSYEHTRGSQSAP